MIQRWVHLPILLCMAAPPNTFSAEGSQGGLSSIDESMYILSFPSFEYLGILHRLTSACIRILRLTLFFRAHLSVLMSAALSPAVPAPPANAKGPGCTKTARLTTASAGPFGRGTLFASVHAAVYLYTLYPYPAQFQELDLQRRFETLVHSFRIHRNILLTPRIEKPVMRLNHAPLRVRRNLG